MYRSCHKLDSARLKRVFSIVLAAVIFSLCSLGALRAQTITAGVTGTVTDTSGARVPHADVVAVNSETNVATPTQTNDEGVFDLRFLPVGTYTVKVSSPSFTTKQFGPFVLEAGQIAKVDAALSIGATSTVDVNDSVVPLINTQNAEVGATIDSKAIASATLVGRSFAELTQYLPGVVATSPNNFSGQGALERAGIGSANNGGFVSVNGNRSSTNNYLLDGIEINETINNTIGYNPSPDALQEVHIVTSNAAAEFGNVGGGDILALTKSGTNAFHGSAFYFLSDYLMDANSWANNHAVPKIAKTSYTQNIFGGTLGGALIRNKAFFFVDYEGVRYHSAGATSATVLTSKMRQGDFSELLNPALCTNGAATCAAMTQLYDSQNHFAPYVGNLGVPITNPVAKFLIAHPSIYPLPNAAPTAGSAITNNYQGATTTVIYNNQFDVKLDYKHSDRDSAFFRYSDGTAGDRTGTPIPIQFPAYNEYPTRLIAINYTHVFSPAIVNEFRAGYTRIIWHQQIFPDPTGDFPAGSGDAVVGIQLPVSSPQTVSGFSSQLVSGLTAIGSTRSGADNVMNTFTFGDNLSWQLRTHLLKMGVNFLDQQQNMSYPGGNGQLGSETYNGTFSSGPAIAGSATSTSGSPLADFVMDRVLSSARGANPGRRGQRSWRSAAFFQDDWKVTSNLVFNLGVRWEYDEPIYEVQDRQIGVDYASQSIVYAGKNGNSRALYNGIWTNFMPRIGFAYNPTPSLVIRGGYGTTVFMEGTGAALRPFVNPPFLFQTSYSGTQATASTGNPGSFLTAETGFSSLAGQTPSLNIWDKNLKPETINEFSLTLEKQLSRTLSLSVGYVGETGQHLIQAAKGNQLRTGCFLNGVAEAANTADCITKNPAPLLNLFENFATFMPENVRSLYPNPGLSPANSQNGNVTLTTSEGMENYNALQISLRQRETHGLQFTANYTYAKALSNSLGFFGLAAVNGPSAYAENAYNNSAEYGPTATDTRHNGSFIVSYALPFGRGRQWLSSSNTLVEELLGGWHASMTGVAFTGLPATISMTTNNSNTNSGTQRPNQYRHLHIANRSVAHWFGTDPSATICPAAGVDNGVCAYGNPANGTFGTAANDTERVPGYQGFNASAFKDFRIYHDNQLTFRADAKNVFNNVSLGPPNVTALNSAFGSITTTRSVARQLQLSLKYSF